MHGTMPDTWSAICKYLLFWFSYSVEDHMSQLAWNYPGLFLWFWHSFTPPPPHPITPTAAPDFPLKVTQDHSTNQWLLWFRKMRSFLWQAQFPALIGKTWGSLVLIIPSKCYHPRLGRFLWRSLGILYLSSCLHHKLHPGWVSIDRDVVQLSDLTRTYSPKIHSLSEPTSLVPQKACGLFHLHSAFDLSWGPAQLTVYSMSVSSDSSFLPPPSLSYPPFKECSLIHILCARHSSKFWGVCGE